MAHRFCGIGRAKRAPELFGIDEFQYKQNEREEDGGNII